MGSLLALNAVIIGIQVVPWWWGFGHVADGVKHQRFLMGVCAHPYPYKLRIFQNLQIKSSSKEETFISFQIATIIIFQAETKKIWKKTIPTRILHETYPFATYADLFPLTKNLPKSPPIAPLHPTA